MLLHDRAAKVMRSFLSEQFLYRRIILYQNYYQKFQVSLNLALSSDAKDGNFTITSKT